MHFRVRLIRLSLPRSPHFHSSPFPYFARRTELVEAEDEDWLVDLESEDLRLNKRERLSVDLDETLALLAVGDSGGGLLLAEALN